MGASHHHWRFEYGWDRQHFRFHRSIFQLQRHRRHLAGRRCQRRRKRDHRRFHRSVFEFQQQLRGRGVPDQPRRCRCAGPIRRGARRERPRAGFDRNCRRCYVYALSAPVPLAFKETVMSCKAASSVLLLSVICCSNASLAQAPATQPAADALVTMDFPADGVELRVLADIVTKRLKIPIIYDDTINNKRVIVHVPKDVPESALLGILQSALRMKQMVLVDAEQPGWKQIVSAQNLAAVAKPAAPGKTPEPGTAVTQIFNLKHADPARAVEAIKPFLS